MRVVLDTNILFEGLTRKGLCGGIVDSWVSGRITPCVSTALALEYEAVLTRNQSSIQREKTLKVLQALLDRAEFVPIAFSYRPQSPDPNDDFVIDCAINASAPIVTSNVRDFRGAAGRLGFEIMTPIDLASILGKG